MCTWHAAGPERRKLKIKDAERYGWQPKEMLAQIASIYIHLGRADGQAIFPRAIAHDERSFRQDMFAEASKVQCHWALGDSSRHCCPCQRSAMPRTPCHQDARRDSEDLRLRSLKGHWSAM